MSVEYAAAVMKALSGNGFLVVAALGATASCTKIESTGAVCGYAEDGGAIDARGRPDGVYSVRDDHLDAAPIVTFDRMKRTGEGLDPANGKRWIGVHLDDSDARAVSAFTAETGKKQIAVVAGGEIASIHTVKQVVTGTDIQVRCCNAIACERWNATLARGEPPVGGSPEHR